MAISKLITSIKGSELLSVTTANLPGAAGGTNATLTPVEGMLAYNTTAKALMQYNGAWSTISPPPTISNISGFLNADTDSTLTVFGTNFNDTTTVKMFDASSGGSQVGSNATTTFVSSGLVKAVFGGGGVPVAGNSVYIEIDNSGTTTRFATAIVVNADPVIALSGNSGTGADTTDHLGTYGGSVAGGGADSNTTLLLNFDRADGGTDFEDSSNAGGFGHKVPASGNAKIKSSPFGDGKTAMFFDGTDDELNVTGHADFAFAGPVSGNSNDFCVEGWYNWSDSMGDRGFWGYTNTGSVGSTDAQLQLYLESSGTTLTLRRNLTGSSVNLQWTWTPIVNTWYHVAIVRYGNNLYLYVNGVANGTVHPVTSVNLGLAASGSTFQIGTDAYSGRFWEGYIDEFRLVKGNAVYTGNFTVPTTRLSDSQSAGAAGTNIAAVTAAQTKLLIHSNRSDEGNTAFADSATTGTTHTITRTGTIHSLLHGGIAPAISFASSGKAFGSSGAYFDGAGDYLTATPWTALGSGVFTIDFWLKFNHADSTGTYVPLMGQTQGTAGFLNINVKNNGAGGHTFYTYIGSQLDSNYVISDGNWHHLILNRDSSNNLKQWVDGTLRATHASITTNFSSTQEWRIGHDNAQGYYFKGYLDMIRVSTTDRTTTSSDPLYSGNNTTYTVPTTLYGVRGAAILPTITLTGTTTPALAADEDIEYTSDVTVENTSKPDGDRHLADTNIGLTLTNLTGDNKSKATITGTIAGAAGTTFTNIPVKAQVRKTLGNAAYANASRVVTFSSSTTTVGLAPAMPVSGTGIPAGATITSVDTPTTITLSANPTGGTLTGRSLVFLDLTRISTINGPDNPAYPSDGGQAMMTIVKGAGGAPVLFNARRYVGTGLDNKEITGFGFQPDLVWFKSRSNTYWHHLFDSLRPAASGGHPYLYPNDTDGSTANTNSLHRINTDGVTLGTSTNTNGSSATYIAWGWKAGGAPSANGKRRTDNSSSETTLVSSNTVGSNNYHTNITNVKQSVNSVGDFSITQYTANSGGADAHIPHGLSGTPDFIIIKSLATNPWIVWHSSLTTPTTQYLVLNTSAITASHAEIWNSTLTNRATSVDFGAHSYTNNQAAAYMMYAWKAVAGVSAFGSYAGNSSSTGAFVNLGFYPRWLMVKCTTDAANWIVWDSARSGATTTGNSMLPRLRPNTTEAEVSNTNNVEWYLSGSDKGWRPLTSEGGLNASGRTYIYMAFA